MKFVRTAQGTLARSTEDGKTLEDARDEAKRLVAEIFDDAMKAAGRAVSNQAVGDMVGVCATRMRALRDPDDLDATSNLVDALLAPHAVYAGLRARLEAQRLVLHGPPLAPHSVEAQAMVAAEASSESSAEIARAMRNGSLEPDERTRIAQRAIDAIREQERLLAMLGHTREGA